MKPPQPEISVSVLPRLDGRGIIPYAETSVVLDETRDTRRMILSMNEEIKIVLDGRDGQGYRWSLERFDSERLALLHQHALATVYVRSGEPSRSAWLFRAVREGTAHVSFCYYRLWDGKSECIKHCSVILDITH